MRTAREHIAAGDIFQVVPSQRFTRPTHAEAFDIYRAVRRINPSPYMFFFDFGIVDGEPLHLVGASPEMLVRLEGGTPPSAPSPGHAPAEPMPPPMLPSLKNCLRTPRNAPNM